MRFRISVTSSACFRYGSTYNRLLRISASWLRENFWVRLPAGWQVVQVDSLARSWSSLYMDVLNEFPPMIWCRCGDGSMPGVTSGSSLSTTSCEHPKRISAWEGAMSARATNMFNCILCLGRWICFWRRETGNRSFDTLGKDPPRLINLQIRLHFNCRVHWSQT